MAHRLLFIALNDGVIINSELEGMWKETIVAEFEVLHRYLP
jgi:hypothetical protein